MTWTLIVTLIVGAYAPAMPLSGHTYTVDHMVSQADCQTAGKALLKQYQDQFAPTPFKMSWACVQVTR